MKWKKGKEIDFSKIGIRLAFGFLIALAAELWFLYFTPPWLLYSDNDVIEISSFVLVFALVFMLLPQTIYIVLIGFKLRQDAALCMSLLSILIVGPTFGLYGEYKAKQKLKESGSWTSCRVIEENRHKGHYIKCIFEANEKYYKTNFRSDSYNNYDMGDTLDIIYWEKYPKMNLLESEWKE